ncbi:pyruvate dehydrogenase (acetyl-transferring) E1 component subunit alpha [Knoellia locipacati]|uniref:Pyruvate dehydrogenase E1 component subunit alpha n=2 Tax=Knoellia locipacati TaxID=882824 RepID=A0A512SZV1_9MICO|nr:pyruvate dehydrogenase E1 component subunit alpha [Knoellia locipacati]
MSDTDVAATPPTGGIDHHVSVDPAAPAEPRSAADGGPDMVQLLTPEGERIANAQYDEIIDAMSNDDLRGLYRDLVLIRRVDQEATALQRQGELGLWASLLGQEAAQIGAGRAMRTQDHCFPGYREHGIAWARGVDPMRLIAMYRGVDKGAWDPAEFGFHPYTIVIGNQSLLGTGYAMGIQRDGAVGTDDPERDAAVIACMGDGATAQGDNNEAFVFAGVYNSPVVFFCQNNQWAISEPNERQTRAPIYKRADGFGFPGIRVDGNDVLGVYAVTTAMLDRARSGEGPSLIEAFTYRMAAHTTSDDPTKYRVSAEVEIWKLRDPIARYRRWLTSEGIADADFFDAIDREADELGEHVRSATVSMADPDVSDIFDQVYVEPHRQVQDDKAAFTAYNDSFAAEEARA